MSETDDLRQLIEKNDIELEKQGKGGEVPSSSISVYGGDNFPAKNVPDVDIDDDELSQYCLSLLKNDIADKEDFGWSELRDYDIKAYYEIKDEFFSNFPYPGASNYPECLTAVLLDTGKATIENMLFRDKLRWLIVDGVGKEDIRNAKNLERVHNWQMINDMPRFRSEMSHNIFQFLLHGTSYPKLNKTLNKEGRYTLNFSTIPIRNIFLPIDARSPEIDDSDHIIQLVAWQGNDLKDRIDRGIYRNLGSISKGLNIGGKMSKESEAQLMAQVTGLDLSKKMTRDTYWAAEAELTYYPRNSVKRRELIVTFSPNNGKILRKIVNEDKIRSYISYFCYPNFGMAFHQSLPQRVRNIQEKINYTDKQITDAMDKEMSKAGFFQEGAGTYPEMMRRSPTGLYPVKNLGTIQWEPQIGMAPIMERSREIDRLWLKAERKTGFSDLYQGIRSGVTDTLGQEQMRAERSDIRFADLMAHVEESWKQTANKIYELNDRYLPRETIISVLGTHEQAKVEQLFPSKDETKKEGIGLGASKRRFNFFIANETISGENEKNKRKNLFADFVLSHPIFGQKIQNAFKSAERKAEALGISDIDDYMTKPKEAFGSSPEEIIERIMNGEKDLLPDVYADPMECILRIDMFKRSSNYEGAEDDIKQEFEKLKNRLNALGYGQVEAQKNFQIRNMVMQNVAQQSGQAGAGSVGESSLLPAGQVGEGKE